MGWETTASGYAAVWATENTRAVDLRCDGAARNLCHDRAAHGGPLLRRLRLHRRRRQYAKPGPCRLHQGRADGRRPGRAPAGKAPTFLVAALKDPIGANLDRYQIVKGWLDAAGEVHEKVYDVAWSGDRKPGADGKLPPVGNTVDVANATWTNTIGAPELIAVWTDPDFDPAQRAFYYGRVIEIPTPRWTAYDAKYFGVTMPPEVHDDDSGARLHLADLVHAGQLGRPKGDLARGTICSGSAWRLADARHHTLDFRYLAGALPSDSDLAAFQKLNGLVVAGEGLEPPTPGL